MGHNLYKEKIAYYGEKPWHGIGTEVNSPMTAIEALQTAQLDYTVGRQDIVTSEGIEVPGKVATVNMEDNTVLGVVGDRYKVVQNREAFNFFDELVGEGQAIYEVCGALGKGERIWMLAKLPGHMTIAREDIVEKYLILTNSHDGTSCLKVYFSPVRVVCQNTLTASLHNAYDTVNIRHSGNIGSKTDEARRLLGLSLKWYTEFEDLCKQLVSHKVSVSEAEGYCDRLAFGDDPAEKESSVLKNRKDDFLNLFESGKGNDKADVKGSAWALYNGVSEYYSHVKTVKGETKDPTNRLKSIWFGNSARQVSKAFDGALELVGVK